MKTPILFKEYIWLVNTIQRAGRISLAEINERWIRTEMSGGVPLARTTFNRHKDAIEDIFGIYIDCDRRDSYRYYIGNKGVLREESVQNWMLSTLSVNNLISESMSLQHRILLENISTDGEFLETTIDAMKKGCRLKIAYRRYQSSETKTYSVSPYCIKLFRQRWYLLGRFDKGYAMLSYDRMENVESLQEHFEIDRDFDVKSFFSECYGVVIGDGKTSERIVLRAYGREAFNLRDLPIHHSQREINEEDGYADFEYRLRPTADFVGYLLSRGRWVKVLKPISLADEIRTQLQEALKGYDE